MIFEEELQIYNSYQVETAFGPLTLYYNEEGIYRLLLPSNAQGDKPGSNTRSGGFPWPKLEEELQGFFQGKQIQDSYPLLTEGYSEWTNKVLRAAGEIPYGETRSYKQVAEQLGQPDAARAVGQALSRNRTPLLIPCHRVVGHRGNLVGFGSGLSWKKRLLELEQTGP